MVLSFKQRFLKETLMFKNNNNPFDKTQGLRQKGVSLFIAFIVMTLILSIALGVNVLLVSQLKSLKDAGYSLVAFGAADAGLEKIAYDAQRGIDVMAQCPSSGVCVEVLSNNAQYIVGVEAPGAGCSGVTYCAKSVGSYEGSFRAVRVAR